MTKEKVRKSFFAVYQHFVFVTLRFEVNVYTDKVLILHYFKLNTHSMIPTANCKCFRAELALNQKSFLVLSRSSRDAFVKTEMSG